MIIEMAVLIKNILRYDTLLTSDFCLPTSFINFIALSFLKNISPNSLTDKELVDLYKQSGDLSVLGELYQRYMDLVYGVCLKYFKDPESAKDGVMQIFEELVSKLKKHEVDNFRGWLHQLAKNH